MARKYTADELIALVRDEARIPDTAATGNADSDILNRINETLTCYLYGMVMEVKEEYFLRTTRYDLSSTEERYKIPARAMYQKLRDVKWAETETGGYFPLAHMNVGQLDDTYSSTTTSDAPSAFYVEGNHIHLWPNLSGATGFIDLSYYLAPGDLVLQANVAKVKAGGIDVDAKTVQLDRALPTTGSATWNGSVLYDIHSPDSGAELRKWHGALTGEPNVDDVNAPILTFDTPIDGSVVGEDPIEVGDYVCLTNEAALPGVPRELHPTVGKLTAAQILEDEGDLEGVQAKMALSDRELYGYKKSKGALERMENRVEAKPRFIRGGNFLDAQGGW